MKKVFGILTCALLAVGVQAEAQSWLQKIGNRVKDNAVDKVEQRIEEKADKATDRMLDKTEQAVKKPSENRSKETNDPRPESPKRTDSYAKYDFVPGSDVFFEDDLKGERKGEFPSRWDLISGNAEIAQIDGENTLAIVGYTFITPLFKEKKTSLPEAFTLEFDIYVDGREKEQAVEFVNESDEVIANSLFWLDNNRFLFNWDNNSNERTSEDTFDNTPGWHHYALSFNRRAMKVYMDDKRVANIPNITEKPDRVRFFARGSEENSTTHIRNIRLAQGAVPLYDRLLADGKIVTCGITFDTGKASLRPQSMGTINEILALLQRYPDLRFSVEGHTDNTGNASSNQALSEARAKAVCAKLEELGISADRLTAKGLGMSRPVETNDTPEGRAKNRRVEFVKIK